MVEHFDRGEEESYMRALEQENKMKNIVYSRVSIFVFSF